MNTPEFSYEPIGLPIRGPIWPAPEAARSQLIVAVGAWCVPGETPGDAEGRAKLSIKIDEFVELSDGTRLSIRWDRGVTISYPEGDSLSETEARHNIEMGLLPDEGEVEDDGEKRSWHEYSDLLMTIGLTASTDELKVLPLHTELSPELLELLAD